MKDWPKDMPWATPEEAEKEIIAAWERIKTRGLKAGVLTRRKDGCLVGTGHPNKLFDLED